MSETTPSTVVNVNDYRLSIPRERLPEMQRALEQAARAGQSLHPLVMGRGLHDMLRATWGLDASADRPERAFFTELQVPAGTPVRTLDTFLSLVAGYLALDKPAYFDITCESGEGDGEQDFFYHFEQTGVVVGQVGVIKEKRLTTYITAELEIVPPRAVDEAAVPQTEEAS